MPDVAPHQLGLAGLAVLLAAFLGNYLWRLLGVALAGRLALDSALSRWVSCVVVAMVVGLIARMALEAPGALSETRLSERLASLAAGLAAFVLLRRSVLAGTLVGAGALAALTAFGGT
ncbi:hypothetical protein AY599_10110 [Leptolyngbya valderiana BDU 20041]|nr:hypothetical protein AY599_10110 [Leptolyngbya valderiana BDU 20041]